MKSLNFRDDREALAKNLDVSSVSFLTLALVLVWLSQSLLPSLVSLFVALVSFGFALTGLLLAFAGLLLWFSLLKGVFLLEHKKLREACLGMEFLRIFRFVCGKEKRELVDFLIADLEKDRMEMRAIRMNQWLIEFITLCQSIDCLAPIAWERLMGVLKAILQVGKLLKEIWKTIWGG